MKYLIAILSLHSFMATASPCLPAVDVFEQQEGLQKLDLTLKSFTVNTHVCIDEKSIQDDFQATLALNRLRNDEPQAFKRPHCFNLNKLTDRDNPDAQLLLKRVMGEDEILQLAYQGQVPKDIYIADSKFDFKAQELFTEEVFSRPVIGTIISREHYGNVKDKNLHAYVGMPISIGASTVAYLMVKDSGMKYDTKKQIISAAGPLSGFIIGVLKEVLYDRQRPKNHTVDKHDAYATGAGAGMIPFKIKIEF
ncbi:MAG: hypothetical protein ACLGG0_05965 [Bacteriovoracia bacterium]